MLQYDETDWEFFKRIIFRLNGVLFLEIYAQSPKINGVKFDGMREGILLDAKGKYSQFINKETGEFYSWFEGKDSLVSEAKRQIAASEGSKIQWYFSKKETLKVVQELFMDKGIKGIELKFEAPK